MRRSMRLMMESVSVGLVLGFQISVESACQISSDAREVLLGPPAVGSIALKVVSYSEGR